MQRSELEQAKECTFQPNKLRACKSRGDLSNRGGMTTDSFQNSQSRQTDPSHGPNSYNAEVISKQHQTSQKARSSQKFIQDQIIWELRKQQRMITQQAQKLNKENENLTFKPQLNKVSEALWLMKKNSTPEDKSHREQPSLKKSMIEQKALGKQEAKGKEKIMTAVKVSTQTKSFEKLRSADNLTPRSQVKSSRSRPNLH